MHPIAALIALPFVTLICLWVAWSDMKFMKIPNKAVAALMAVYVLAAGLWTITGLMPWQDALWGLALGGIVLVIGFIVTALGMVGAGDSKFAAAMAPFFVGAQLSSVLALFAACLLAAFFIHRLIKWTPALRRSIGDWESWQRQDFPMGLALTGTMIVYLLWQAWPLFAPVSA
jgi:prepilin peptidase CpaA